MSKEDNAGIGAVLSGLTFGLWQGLIPGAFVVCFLMFVLQCIQMNDSLRRKP